jgi:hypothetical protein
MNLSVSLCELATDLARMHEASASGAITVIQVIVDDLSAALPVLGSLCEVTNGVLLDVSEPFLQTAVPATDDYVRRAASEASLTSAPIGNRHVVLVDQPNDMVDTEFREPSGGANPSPGERTVLGVARAVAHKDLDIHQLGIIVYRDTQVDYPFRRSIWNLAVNHLANMPHTTLRTLIFVAESPIQIELHCQRRTGFRLAIDGERLLHRHGEDDLTAWASRIANSPEPFVLFLGAGFSASSGLPLGNRLRDKAIRNLIGIPETEPIGSDELAKRFRDWIAGKPGWRTESEERMTLSDYVEQLTLEQVVRAEQRFLSSLPTLNYFKGLNDTAITTPGPAVLDLMSILPYAQGRLILAAVNFDLLVETHSPVPLEKFVSDSDFEGAAEYLARYLNGSATTIPLLKFHGSIDRPETCVVSAEQTEAGVSDGKLKALRSLFYDPPRLWIYVGMSMRDRDLLRAFNDADFGRGTDEVWVTPYLVPTIEEYAWPRQTAFWARRDFRTLDERLISEIADVFMSALRAAWPT